MLGGNSALASLAPEIALLINNLMSVIGSKNPITLE